MAANIVPLTHCAHCDTKTRSLVAADMSFSCERCGRPRGDVDKIEEGLGDLAKLGETIDAALDEARSAGMRGDLAYARQVLGSEAFRDAVEALPRELVRIGDMLRTV